MSVSHFNEMAPKFLKLAKIHDSCSKQIVMKIKEQEWLKPVDLIMDFGCGVGSFTIQLYQQIGYKECLGVDSSEVMIEWFNKVMIEKHMEENTKGKCAYLEREDQLDGKKFDAIVSLKAFHHIPDPLHCIQLLKSYLNPGGRLIIADLLLNAHSPQYHKLIKEPPCCHGFTEDSLRHMFTAAGMASSVVVVDMVHFELCDDQERGRRVFESEPEMTKDLVDMEKEEYPQMIRIGERFYERDVFPFVIGCGVVYACLFELRWCVLV